MRNVTFTATTVLPYQHLERAAAGLRAELRRTLLGAGVTDPPDWTALTVEGSHEFLDARGRTWFGYWATLSTADEVS